MGLFYCNYVFFKTQFRLANPIMKKQKRKQQKKNNKEGES